MTTPLKPIAKVEVYHTDTGKVEKVFDVSQKTERYIEKLVNGISINLGRDYGVRMVRE